MFVLVVGGGKVGYYLTKELIASGHEVALMEKDRRRAELIKDEIGSVVIAQDGCEGKYLHEAGANRADIVAAVTGDDEDNLVICQMAKHHFDVPRTIARVNNPKNERAVPPPRRGRDHQPHPDDPGLDRAGHPGPRAAPPRGPGRRRAGDHRGAPAARLAGHRQDRPRHPGARGLLDVRCHPRTGRPRRSTATRCSPRATRSSRSAGPTARRSCALQLIGEHEEA